MEYIRTEQQVRPWIRNKRTTQSGGWDAVASEMTICGKPVLVADRIQGLTGKSGWWAEVVVGEEKSWSLDCRVLKEICLWFENQEIQSLSQPVCPAGRRCHYGLVLVSLVGLLILFACESNSRTRRKWHRDSHRE